MKLYFTDRQVPELAKLGDSQRQVVRREAYKNYTSGQRSWERNVRFVNLLAVLIGLRDCFCRPGTDSPGSG